MKTYTTTPKQDGFRMPGEFEPHEGCWTIWPERPDNWRLGAKPAQKVFVEVAKAISRFEPVTVCVSNAQYDKSKLRRNPNFSANHLIIRDSCRKKFGFRFNGFSVSSHRNQPVNRCC
ncbi:MAG: agmatine deiminase family protein, partial [Enterocloster clostridioformis]|nr:agmatine deiminase family protein [Enterocloster clostridioformis]